MAIAANFPSTRPSLSLDFANVGRLDPRVTFSRASSATFYDGVTTAKAEENLFAYSQEFNDAYWTKTRSTVTANSDTAPDGTVTADSVLQASGQTTSGNVFRSVSVAAGDVVISCFAKPNGKNFVVIREVLADGTNKSTWFNVSTGTIGTTNASHTATITSSTNNYYRCSIKFTANAARTGSVEFFLADTDGSLTVADDGNGLYLWGAQLEQRSAVTAYTATTTQPITNYVPVLLTAQNNEARFDHTPTTGAALGLEVEEQRTNLFTYSDDFANAAWSKGNSSISSNVIIAPDGTLTGDKLIPNSGQTGGANTNQTVSKSATSTTYAYSCYAKAGEFASFRLYFNDAATAANRCEATYNTSTGETSSVANAGTFSGASALMTAVGNGWYRCVLIATTSTETSVQCRISNAGSGQTGDGYSGIFIWGAQLEAGAFATSYIPTTTTALTRSADVASMTGTNFSSWYNAAEGTLFVQAITPPNLAGFPAVANINDGSAQNVIAHYLFINGYYANVVSGNVNQGDAARLTAPVVGNVYKFAVGIKLNDANGAANGLIGTADTSLLMPVGVNQIRIGANHSGGTVCNTHIQRIAYYPVRLADAQLQALTA